MSTINGVIFSSFFFPPRLNFSQKGLSYGSPSQTRALKNFHWCRLGAERRLEHAQTRERGPPSAPAEIIIIIRFKFLCLPDFLIPMTLCLSVTHLWSPPYCFMGGRYSPTRPRRISPATSKHSLKDMEMEWEYYKLYIFHILLIICS